MKEAKSYHERQAKIDRDAQQNNASRKSKVPPADAIVVNTASIPKLNPNAYNEDMETLYRSNETKEYTINVGSRKMKMHKFVLVIG